MDTIEVYMAVSKKAASKNKKTPLKSLDVYSWSGVNRKGKKLMANWPLRVLLN